jgi:16S rRNA (guanine966-N2)-methyltransferase
VRVIAGKAHGRRLSAPRGWATRPATARIRESIFSRLSARMELTGTRVLDLYAGSGSLGIEALSRGAAHVTFVEASRPAARAIERNLHGLELETSGKIMTAQVFRALAVLSRAGEKFDLVFVDPPYAQDRSSEVLARLEGLALLADRAWVMIRQSDRAPAVECHGFELVNVATVGNHRLSLYRRLAVLQN